MKKDYFNDNDEFIIYKSKKIKDLKAKDTKASQNDLEKFKRVLKRQTRNTKIFCIGIFLFFLAMACFFGMAEFFLKYQLENIWLVLTLTIVTLAIGLIVYTGLTSSKEGKIKYNYKNEKYFYLAGIFTGLGVFALFGGFKLFGFSNTLFISFILLGLGATFDIYHDKTGGKENNLNLVREFVIALTICIVFGFIGYFINVNSNNFESNYEIEETI